MPSNETGSNLSESPAAAAVFNSSADFDSAVAWFIDCATARVIHSNFYYMNLFYTGIYYQIRFITRIAFKKLETARIAYDCPSS